MEFLGLFKDSIFVSISKVGGHVAHTHNMREVMMRNEETSDGAYFTVNGFANFEEGAARGRTKQNVTSFNASFLDIDLTPETRRTEAEAVYKTLCDTGLQPTAVVLTGKGLHVYWVYAQPSSFSEYKLKEYEILQSAIVEHFSSKGADRQARDAARVLRIPGARYYDSKGSHTCDVELMYFNQGMKYDSADVARYFKDSIRTETREGQALVAGDSDFDLASIYNVKKGGRHHMAYSAALSLIQRSKSLADARQLFHAALNTWESEAGQYAQEQADYWKQFDNAVRMLEKDRPQLFIGDAESAPITFTAFEDIKEEPLEWLWDGYLLRGKSHMLAGMPGLGKSQITVDIAMRLSTGRPFPSVTLGAREREPMGVIILSAEDGAADTIRPRLRAAGANMKMVYSMRSSKLVRDRTGKMTMRGVALKEDAELILQAIATLPFKIGMIIVDPASAFMSEDADANSNNDVRSMFNQLQEVIMNKGIGMLMINHLNKNTSAKGGHMRSLGSTAWTAVARATMYVVEDASRPGRCVFGLEKANLAKKEGHGFFYEIAEKTLQVGGQDQSTPFIRWNTAEFPTKSVTEYLSDSAPKTPEKDECGDALELYMASKGSVSAKEGLRYMKEQGFQQATVYRAARRLGIIGEEHGIWKR